MIRLILRISMFLFILVYNFSSTVIAETPSPVINVSGMKKIGEMTTGGVRAIAYIKSFNLQGNLNATHTVAVTFVNEKTGVPVAEGLVGIKHRKLYGDTSDPVWMASPPGQSQLFVSEISLKKPGTYLFIVGSKLEDNKKRQFTFQYRN